MKNNEYKEVIKHAAVRSIHSWIFIGKCHADCFYKMKHTGVEASKKSYDQGFVTNKGRYVDRADAAKIAFEAGQIETEESYLISEMLWHQNDNGKYEYSEIEGYYK